MRATYNSTFSQQYWRNNDKSENQSISKDNANKILDLAEDGQNRDEIMDTLDITYRAYRRAYSTMTKKQKNKLKCYYERNRAIKSKEANESEDPVSKERFLEIMKSITKK